MKKFLFFLTAGWVLATAASAQDRIYRMNPVEEIEGRVLEVGEQSVRYTRADTRDDVIFNVPVQYLQKIVFEDGKELVYNDVVDVSNDRRDAIKLSFLSLIYDAPTLFYERGIRPGQSMEVGLGVIGVGLAEPYADASGVIVKAGYKFMSRPEHYQNKFRYAHLLKGSYIKPELTLVHYGYSDEFYEWPGGNGNGPYERNRKQVTLFNVGIVGGKQWVFDDKFLLDLFCGVGFALGDNDEAEGWHYNFVGGAPEMPATFTAGFKVGILLGKKR